MIHKKKNRKSDFIKTKVFAIGRTLLQAEKKFYKAHIQQQQIYIYASIFNIAMLEIYLYIDIGIGTENIHI